MSSPRQRPDLSRLLNPQSIAIFGGYWAERVVTQCQELGFSGQIWPVSPTRADLCGIACFRSIADLPGAPDAAFIAVNRYQSVDVVRQLALLGAGGAVCFASGFREAGACGAELQDELISASGAMPFLGPNCYGLINYVDGALLWPDQHGGQRTDRGVALLMQSGNIAINMTMNRRALPISYVAALGNQAKIGLSDLIEALAVSDRVSAIGLLVEGIKDVSSFAAAVHRAAELNVPIVALKSGRSKKGAELAVTHTGSLVGNDDVMDALFRRIGVARVSSLPVLLETLKILHVHGPLPGKTVCSMSCSGGEALLISDAAAERDLNFRCFTHEDKARIRPTVNPLVTISNPFDYHTFDWADEKRLSATFSAVMESNFDLSLLVIDFPHADRADPSDWDRGMSTYVEAVDRIGARAGILATLPECLTEDRAQALIEQGLVPLVGIDDALQAIDAAAFFGLTPRAIYEPLVRPDVVASQTRLLTEWEAKQELALHGVRIPEGRICHTGDDVKAAVEELQFPLVAKAVGRNITHKTELDAVRLNLANLEEILAAREVLASVGDAVLVEQMAPTAVAELFVGCNVDPIAGPYLVVGAGGVMAELLRDTRVLLLPTTREDITAALSSLAVSRLLTGYRGGVTGDVNAAIAAILSIAAWVSDNHQDLVSIDVNPLIVGRLGEGALAVDALIELREE